MEERQAGIVSRVVDQMAMSFFPNLRTVGDPKYQPFTDIYDFGKLFEGWKDGVFGVLDEDSKWNHCNGNFTQASDIYQFEFDLLFDPKYAESNFASENQIASYR